MEESKAGGDVEGGCYVTCSRVSCIAYHSSTLLGAICTFRLLPGLARQCYDAKQDYDADHECYGRNDQKHHVE